MLQVFKETEAAKQIRRYGEEVDWDEARILEVIEDAYNNACKQGSGFDTYLFKSDVGDSLDNIDIDCAFIWADTAEGADFWRKINNE